MEQSIKLGTLYKLGSSYKENYNCAIVTYDLKTAETVVELISNWNSGYNKTDRYTNFEPLDVVRIYQ